MYLRCPECKTRYEISAASIPDGGARVRCPRCRTVFGVSRGAARPAGPPEPGSPEPGAPEFGAPGFGAPGFGAPDFGTVEEPAGDRDAIAVTSEAIGESGAGGGALNGAEFHDQPARAAENPVVVDSVAGDSVAGDSGTGDSGGTRAPGATLVRPRRPATSARPVPAAAHSVVPGAPVEADVARRIARALVSELLLARRDQRNEALREGRLLARLGPAILDAWDRYRERVGDPVAQGTRFFQEAVNDILGDGRSVL